MNLILQKGYIRTCTNYTRVLLEKNFHSKVVTVAKHDDREGLYTDMDSYIELVKEQNAWPHNIDPALVQELYTYNQLKFVVCIKNPYSWFHSVSKTGPSMHRPDPLSPWPIITKFNDRYRAWRGIIEENKNNAYIVRHEDLLDSFEETLVSIGKQLQLQNRLETFSNESKDVLGQHKGQKRIGHKAYSQKFNKMRMPLDSAGEPIYDHETFERIREEIDWEVVNYYGYECYNDTYENLYEQS